jgi:hypothetical protein
VPQGVRVRVPNWAPRAGLEATLCFVLLTQKLHSVSPQTALSPLNQRLPGTPERLLLVASQGGINKTKPHSKQKFSRSCRGGEIGRHTGLKIPR